MVDKLEKIVATGATLLAASAVAGFTLGWMEHKDLSLHNVIGTAFRALMVGSGATLAAYFTSLAHDIETGYVLRWHEQNFWAGGYALSFAVAMSYL